MKNIFFRAIFAGILISLGGIAYLKVGGLSGALLFAFGLASVVNYKLPLFTGRAGFVELNANGLMELFVTWLGNLVGCALIGTFVGGGDAVLRECSAFAISTRYCFGISHVFFSGVLCGIIMTTAVKFASKGEYIPLLLGVPLFILCGFSHSIADLFYLSAMPCHVQVDFNIVVAYLAVFLGNFVGCNIPRIFGVQRYKKELG